MRDKKLTVLVDVDDTIEDLLGAWIDWLNHSYDMSFVKDQVTEWDLTKSFAPLTKQQIFEPLSLEEFWDTVMPKPGAQETLLKLMDDGHDVYLVTATHYTTLRQKYDHMISRIFPYFDWDHIIVTSNKHLVHGDLLIDDGPHNLGTIPGILFDAPHNRGVDAEELNAVRLNNWRDIYDYVTMMARQELRRDYDEMLDRVAELTYRATRSAEAVQKEVELYFESKERDDWRKSGFAATYTPVSTSSRKNMRLV